MLLNPSGSILNLLCISFYEVGPPVTKQETMLCGVSINGSAHLPQDRQIRLKEEGSELLGENIRVLVDTPPERPNGFKELERAASARCEGRPYWALKNWI